MVSSKAETVAEYLDALPEDRKHAIRTLRGHIRRVLPKGFKEVMQYGMISWVVPLSRYPDTYNRQPLAVLSLASQKQYMSLYLLGVYGHAKLRKDFERAYAKAGKKLDMGKSCLRFKKLDDLALDAVIDAVGKLDVDAMIELTEAAHKSRK